jgi:hypothetical protein
MAASGLWIVIALTSLVGCSQVLGFKDPTLEKPGPDIDAAIDTAIDTAPVCVPSDCQFGCDTTTNACRDGKLWIFKTGGAYSGNGFGGLDTPPDVRAGADGKCLQTYGSAYTMKECNTNNVRAILYVSSADSIALMATKYNIPTSVPVLRANDDVLVSNNWNDLTDPTRALRAPATTAPAGDEATVWTGANGTATCLNWTSRASGNSGTIGFTDRTISTWLSQNTFTCNLAYSLLCICWSGGQ